METLPGTSPANPMATISDFLNATPEKLINYLFPASANKNLTPKQRIRRIAYRLGMRSSQVLCGIGFNPAIGNLPDVIDALGYTSLDELVQERNTAFVEDVYLKLSIEDILALYESIKNQYHLIDMMQYLLPRRLNIIEQHIEATVNPLVIERYKKEMHAVYSTGIAQIDFAEARLNNTHSGFRALINEVMIIVDTKLMPVGDIFFRDTVLPEEKRKLLKRGLVPMDFVRARLEDNSIPERERQVLEEHLNSSTLQ